MKFDVSSFVVGCAVGAGAAALYPRLKPLIVDLAAAGYRTADALAARIGVTREDFEDVLAEARARARGPQVVAAAPPERAT